MRRCESVRRIYIRYALTTGKRKGRKTVAPDRTKLAAGATEKEKVRKTVAPDGTKLAAGATGKGKVRRPVVPMEKTSRHNYRK